MADWRFDEQGHAIVSPAEFERLLLQARHFLINAILIPSVPAIFPTRSDYQRFLEHLSDELKIHPRNLAVRGSTLLGFSLHPNSTKVWSRCTERSDIDLAIIDSDYYHVIDREARHFDFLERRRHRISVADQARIIRRETTRKFYYYRYFDLPDVPAIVEQREVLSEIPSYRLDRARTISAFVFRDWWSLYHRWDYELQSLKDGLEQERVIHGGEEPRFRSR